MDLLEELGIETFPQYLTGEKFMQVGSNKIRSYKTDIPSLSPLGLLDTHRMMTLVSLRPSWEHCCTKVTPDLHHAYS